MYVLNFAILIFSLSFFYREYEFFAIFFQNAKIAKLSKNKVVIKRITLIILVIWTY